MAAPPKRLRGLRWTFWALFVPAALGLLGATFVLPLGLLSPFPVHEGPVGTWAFELWFALAALVSLAAAWLAAWWAALTIWRSRLSLEAVTRHFDWAADPSSGRLFHWATKAMLPVLAWVLRRVYGQAARSEGGENSN